MPKNKTLLFQRILGIINSLSIIAAGICLIAACLSIYYDGNGYSREAVRNAFHPIAVPVFICIGLIVITFIFSFFVPFEEGKSKRGASHYTLALIRSKRDEENGDASVLYEISRQKKRRLTVTVIQLVVFIVCCAVFLSFALDPTNYHDSDINGSVIKAMCVMLPCLALSFGIGLFGIMFSEKSIKKEIELLKSLPVLKGSDDAEQSIKKNKAFMIAVKITVVIFGIALLVYGAFSGGTADVLTKAVNICTECIGLG